MLRVISITIFLIILFGCASKGPDIIRPVQQDSPDYPTSPAVLRMPLTLLVLDVDGEQQATMLTNTDPYEIHLSAGLHKIDFQYYKEWGTGGSADVVESDVMRVSINAMAGQTYELQYEKPLYKSDAKKLVNGFDAWIDDPIEGARITAVRLDVIKSSFASVLLGTDKADTQEGVIEPVKQSVTISNKQAVMAELKASWKKATKEERQAFLNWVLVEKSE